jgi:hypothetical protein
VNVLDLPGSPEARARGDLAERMVGKAADLALLVRDEGRESVCEFLGSLGSEEKDALLVVLAAMAPVEDQSAADMLAWVRFDEFGRPLDRPLAPCGTYAAFRRHKQRGELTDDECERAAREYWQARNAMRKEAARKKAGRDAA